MAPDGDLGLTGLPKSRLSFTVLAPWAGMCSFARGSDPRVRLLDIGLARLCSRLVSSEMSFSVSEPEAGVPAMTSYDQNSFCFF